MKCTRYTILKVTHLSILSCPAKFLGSDPLAVAAEMTGLSQMKLGSLQPITSVYSVSSHLKSCALPASFQARPDIKSCGDIFWSKPEMTPLIQKRKGNLFALSNQ